MRYALIFLLLAGCGLNPAYREARDAERIAKYEKDCEKLGFKVDTEKMSECKLQMKLSAESRRSSAPQKTTTTCQTFGNTTQCY